MDIASSDEKTKYAIDYISSSRGDILRDVTITNSNIKRNTSHKQRTERHHPKKTI